MNYGPRSQFRGNGYLEEQRNRMRRKKNQMRYLTWAVMAVIVIAVVVVAIVGASANSHVETVTCSVTGKDHTIDKNDNPVYRVYTSGGSDCTTFNIGDSAWFGNFNSADLYGRLQEGKTYRMEVSGFRNGFLSMFPTIRSASEVTQ